MNLNWKQFIAARKFQPRLSNNCLPISKTIHTIVRVILRHRKVNRLKTEYTLPVGERCYHQTSRVSEILVSVDEVRVRLPDDAVVDVFVPVESQLWQPLEGGHVFAVCERGWKSAFAKIYFQTRTVIWTRRAWSRARDETSKSVDPSSISLIRGIVLIGDASTDESLTREFTGYIGQTLHQPIHLAIFADGTGQIVSRDTRIIRAPIYSTIYLFSVWYGPMNLRDPRGPRIIYGKSNVAVLQCHNVDITLYVKVFERFPKSRENSFSFWNVCFNFTCTY